MLPDIDLEVLGRFGQSCKKDYSAVKKTLRVAISGGKAFPELTPLRAVFLHVATCPSLFYNLQQTKRSSVR
jgi:hypothetical protein